VPHTTQRAGTPSLTPNGVSATRSLRILAADSDPSVREFFLVSLPALGHQVCVADSARQVLELCRAVSPDLVIAEAKWSDTCGLDLAAAICHERPVAILLASDRWGSDEIWRHPDCHVVGYLHKPLTAEAVGAAAALAVRCFDRMQLQAAEVGELRQTLEDRKLIERAKGLLMRYAQLGEDEAYRRLRATATRGGRKVVEIAREVVAAGDVFRHLGDDALHLDGAAPGGKPHPAHLNGHPPRHS
jgi:response regulator NasT